jgi:quercetin dioxygenase-like cupin family protein
MKSKIVLPIIIAGLAALAYAAVPPKNAVILIDHEKVAAAFAQGGVMLQTNNFKVQAGRRNGPGTVEIHEQDTDIFYVLDGTATFVTGGQATETNTVSPGEIRGKEITGGDPHKLVKGDVIVVPNGTPHWFTQTSDPFLYLVVKVSK